MGIIRAAVNAVHGSFADQWLETVEPYEMGEHTVFTEGILVRKGQNKKVEYPRRGLLPGPWNVSKAFDGKRWKQGAGRVRMFSDGTGGVVWNWITGEAVFWFDDAGKKLTKAERASLLKRAAIERRKWDEEHS